MFRQVFPINAFKERISQRIPLNRVGKKVSDGASEWRRGRSPAFPQGAAAIDRRPKKRESKKKMAVR